MSRPLDTSVWRFSPQRIYPGTDILYVTGREPYRYVDEGDAAIIHEVRGTRVLDLICAAVYRGVVARPQHLWMVAADFQPDPITNPFALLDVGRVLVLPSFDLLRAEILNERARVET